MKPPVRREADIQREILRYLAMRRVYARRINVGMIPNGRGGFRSSGMVGISDIIGVLPSGKFLAIECKRPGAKPTPAQAEFLHRVNMNGGLGFVATSVEDVEERLR